VATDLDGTLLRPDGTVSDRTVSAVRRARGAGIQVIPVTGRPPHVTWDIAADAGLGPLGVCANGAALVDVSSRQVLEVSNLAAEVCGKLVGHLRDALPGILFAVEEMGLFSYEADFLDPVAWGWEEDTQRVSDIVQALSASCFKLIFRVPGWSARELIAAVEADLSEMGHVTSSGFDWVEIGAPGVSKAYAMQRVCDRLGVKVSEVMAVGDNHNDLTVLAWAGRAVAPANAIPEVLAAVERVIPSNSDDGVAQLLEELAGGAASAS